MDQNRRWIIVPLLSNLQGRVSGKGMGREGGVEGRVEGGGWRWGDGGGFYLVKRWGRRRRESESEI
jgi:hypothetical protein